MRHPLHVCFEFYSDTHIPNDIFLSILSFMNLSDIPWLHKIQRYIYTQGSEFNLPKPRLIFEPMVWVHRATVCKPAGVILYAIDKMQFCYQDCLADVLNLPDIDKILVQLFIERFALRGHPSCNSGFQKIVSGKWDDIQPTERRFLHDHFKSDWIPRIKFILGQQNIRCSKKSGIGTIVMRMVSGIILCDRFDDSTVLTIAQYLMDRLSDKTDAIFRECVIIINPCDFINLIIELLSHSSYEIKQIAKDICRIAKKTRLRKRILENLPSGN